MAVRTPEQARIDQAELAARRFVAAALAMSLCDPAPDVPDPPSPDLLRGAWDILAERYGSDTRAALGLGELTPAEVDAAALARWLALPGARRAKVMETVFGFVILKDCPAYETEYCPTHDATHRSHHMADAAGFFRAFGVRPDADRPQRVDHIGLQIEFVWTLLERIGALRGHPTHDHNAREALEVCEEALREFLKDHVVWWMPTLAACVKRRIDRIPGDAPPRLREDLALLAEVSRVLRAWVGVERRWAGIDPPRRVVEPSVFVHDPDDDSCMACDSCDTIPA